MKKWSEAIIKDIVFHKNGNTSFIFEDKAGKYKDVSYDGTTDIEILRGAHISYSTIGRSNYGFITAHIHVIKEKEFGNILYLDESLRKVSK